jgi:CXXX repeat peptide maturase
MLKYLIILLDDTSTSYCHYEVNRKERRLISLEDLKAGITFAMTENLNVQFVYPDYELPAEYLEVIDSIDHTDIKPVGCSDEADVMVLSGGKDKPASGSTCIIRCTRQELSDNLPTLTGWLSSVERLNIVLTDVEAFSDDDTGSYKETLDALADGIVDTYLTGKPVQVNLLTDCLILKEMNNCGAGDSSVTLAPDGKFYICPAYYYEDEKQNVGDLSNGLSIKNSQLLRLDHAPICRQCDAYHCRRCIWMNSRLTMDANTPSHQQCVVAHVERNASRYLQQKLQEKGMQLSNSYEITEIDYLDPFNIVNRWK